MIAAGYLLLTGSPDVARVYPITGERTVIGREGECQLRLVFPTVSRTHCVVWAEGEKIHLQDLKSNSGTYVNGSKVKHRLLQFGDLIQVGPLVMQVLRAHKPHDAVFAIGDSDTETADCDDPAVSTALLGLSSEESEIVRLLALGKSEKEVAAELNVNQHSLHSQIKDLYERLDISSRAELSAWFWSGGKHRRV